MKQVMYGIKIVDVNDFGGWIGYEPVKQEMADVLNLNLIVAQNEIMRVMIKQILVDEGNPADQLVDLFD